MKCVTKNQKKRVVVGKFSYIYLAISMLFKYKKHALCRGSLTPPSLYVNLLMPKHNALMLLQFTGHSQTFTRQRKFHGQRPIARLNSEDYIAHDYIPLCIANHLKTVIFSF